MRTLLNKLNAHGGEFNVSLIVPIEHEGFDKDVNRNRVKAAIHEVREKILARRADYDFLIDKLFELFDEIDWEHPTNGIGLFVSPSISEAIYFANPVTEKIIVDDHFETRDIVYEIAHAIKYWLLVISLNRTRLFHGEGRKLSEMNDENFPLHFFAEFDFDQPPSRFRSVEGTEESQVNEERKKEFLRKVDSHLRHFLLKERLPVVVAGVGETVALFEGITRNSGSISGKIFGNFDRAGESELASKAMNQLIKHEREEKEKLIRQFNEAVGSKKCVWGVENVWQAAIDGKCDTLLVEKDYLLPAMFTNELFVVNKNGGNENLSPRTSDVVNDIINMVMLKKGKVIFADNDELDSFKKIASLLRY